MIEPRKNIQFSDLGQNEGELHMLAENCPVP